MEIAYYCVTNKIDSKNNLIQSAHQPNFLPWIGYFAKINQSHVFVFSDDVRYSKQQLTNRANFIDVNGKTFTCTIPVNKTSGSRLFEKTITLEERRILDRGIARIKNDYRSTPFYSDMCNIIYKVHEMLDAHHKLVDFNVSCIGYLAKIFNINYLQLLGTELNLHLYESNQRLVQRAKALEIPNYLCGRGAASYHDDEFLHKQGLNVLYANYSEIENQFGSDAGYSILHTISHYGIEKIREHFTTSAYRAVGVAYVK